MKRIANIVAMVLATLWVIAVSAEVKSPDAVVRETTEQLLASLRVEKDVIKENPGRIDALASEIVLPHIDIERMSQWVLGKHWRKGNDDQRNRFSREFQILLLRSYGATLAAYSDQKIKYFPTSVRPGQKKKLVRIEIQLPGRPSIPATFSMHRKDDQWLVYDFKVEGISLVSNYRSNFSSIIRRGGLEELIAYLTAHNQKMQASL